MFRGSINLSKKRKIIGYRSFIRHFHEYFGWKYTLSLFFWPAVVDPLQEVLLEEEVLVPEVPHKQEHHPQHHHHFHHPTGPLPQMTLLPRGWSCPWARPGRGAWWEWRRCWPHFWRCPPAGSGLRRLNAALSIPACPSPSEPPAIPEQDHHQCYCCLLYECTMDVYICLLAFLISDSISDYRSSLTSTNTAVMFFYSLGPQLNNLEPLEGAGKDVMNIMKSTDTSQKHFLFFCMTLQ